ncbi:hypothetical protein ALC62_12823 [Cyphomyrmex costatus]|uniref:DUF4218 domain-containing protein n=1 Tax=Cyphomyrmex costatus TaxID=456900 RepID=A0A151IAJ8_9HYME|nr:hypothetical protein ALC62_12823 [Cyphomyrmex costatus]
MPKNIRYLSKRRCNQIVNNELNSFTDYFSLQSTVPHVASSSAVEETAITYEIPNVISYGTSIVLSCSNTLERDANQVNEVLESQCNTESDEELKLQENALEFTNISNITEKSLNEDLQTLVIKHNIPHNTVNELLQILKKHGHSELPNDIRTLMSTPRNASVNIKSLGGGQYIHFGISIGLERSIKMYNTCIKSNNIKLNINIDGLPISKSSGSQFWPIMASIENIDLYTSPFIIGVYHGRHKPHDANEFLADFVNEFLCLSQCGLLVSNKKYTVSINAIVCDTPARSFITYTKGHTGYFGCPKCIQEGDFVRNRVTFPETHCTLRSNNTFKNRTQIEHHTGNSILENLPIGMVSQIPLDYMHLVCLGVMKRLLQLWLRGNKNVRLSADKINRISHYLLTIKSCIPSEFARKPRSLHDIDKWKATEFRQFLLYTGIVVLKSIMTLASYNHFLSLSIAIRILTDPKLCITFNEYANSLLMWFVSNYGDIYGDEYLSFNVHNLIHLANDVKTFGCLENFSCFKFENYMQKIKKKLHQSGKPLQELSNRIFEELQIPIQPCCIEQFPIVIYKPRSLNKVISYLQFKSFKVSINEVDNCVLLYDRSCASERLSIFLISNSAISDIIQLPITEIQKKCLKIKSIFDDDSYVVIPLLLTNN